MNIEHYSPFNSSKVPKTPLPNNTHKLPQEQPPPWRPHDQKYVAKRGEIGVSG